MNISKLKKYSLLFFLLTLQFYSAGLLASDTAERFEAHMDFLASDLLRGRDTGSVGHEIAAQYIATEFAKLGIVPAGDDGSYQQRVPFKSALLNLDSVKMSVTNDAGEHVLKFMSEFLVMADVSRTDSQVSAELVFAGFGIDAPYLNYSDFDHIDLKGKIAVVLRGKPITFPSEEGSHYSKTSEQAMVDRGAIGLISVSTPQMEKVRGFDRGKAYLDKPRISWINHQGEIGKGHPELMASAKLSVEAGKKLFDLAGMDYDKIIKQTEKGKQPKAQAMDLTAHINYQSTHSEISSPNVLGILEGSDPVLKNEYVLLTAHTDHIGVSTHIELGDKINNGAMDNAAGVTTLLEMAHQITHQNDRPKRSILFAMVTAEEKGLLGSDYFAHYPTVPIDSIVANINLDMPILTNAFDQLIGFGAQHSSLWGVIERAVQYNGMSLIADPMPEQGVFVRSDQYSFVKKGIPAVFMVTADNSDRVFEEHEVSSQEFIMKHYHQPSDQLDLPINYDVAAKFVAINRAIANEVANTKERPSWNKDSFFASITKD